MTSKIAPFTASEPQASVLAHGKKLLQLAHLTGILAAVLFSLALFSLGDALQALMRQDFNRIDVVAGEEALISGPLPANVTSLTEMQVRITGEGAVLFTPVDTYKGFWLGGNMWRATVTADADVRSSQAVLTVIDPMPPKKGSEATQEPVQNGSLVFPLYVWASAAEKDKASSSIFTRFFGVNAFIIAAFCTLSALIVTCVNSLIVRDVEKRLGTASIYLLQGRKQEKTGYIVSFASPLNSQGVDAQVYLYDRQWRMQASGTVVEIGQKMARAMVPLAVSPRFGWFVSFHKI